MRPPCHRIARSCGDIQARKRRFLLLVHPDTEPQRPRCCAFDGSVVADAGNYASTEQVLAARGELEAAADRPGGERAERRRWGQASAVEVVVILRADMLDQHGRGTAARAPAEACADRQPRRLRGAQSIERSSRAARANCRYAVARIGTDEPRPAACVPR